MPADLVARISASIAQEQSAREGGTVVPLRRRSWGWQHLGAAAAAAVVLAVGIPALLTGTGPGDVMASLGGSVLAPTAPARPVLPRRRATRERTPATPPATPTARWPRGPSRPAPVTTG